ncbi:MAG TPA: GGDEF domain-containing protein [Acidimicrobiales bacterium]|nr:GGDEF domain-containing protein [Acidimicrobiales bacterium]
MSYSSNALSLDQLSAEIDLLDPDLPVAVTVLDIDGFKELNDAQGEEVGDQALAELERCLRAGLPAGALVAHVRGDEFAAALPDAACEEALIALEAVRANYCARPAAPGIEARLGLSAGVAGRPAHGSTAAELLEAADTGLVRAKQAGGNRVALHLEERMILKSSYYTRPALHRLAKLARRTGRPEASLLRDALDDYLARHRAWL